LTREGNAQELSRRMEGVVWFDAYASHSATENYNNTVNNSIAIS
jgi:hypothetical protein